MTRNPSKQWFKGTRGDTEENLEAVSVVAEMEERRYSEGGIDKILIGWEGKKKPGPVSGLCLSELRCAFCETGRTW